LLVDKACSSCFIFFSTASEGGSEEEAKVNLAIHANILHFRLFVFFKRPSSSFLRRSISSVIFLPRSFKLVNSEII
jgi:hypothetical protein